MIYLDNAATTYPKPENVAEEVLRCIKDYGGNAGRGGHRLSMTAADKIYECRAAMANLFSAPSPGNVIFVPNATYGLNTAIMGLLTRGTHAIVGDLEHNSVRRPLDKSVRDGEIEYTKIKTLHCFSPLGSDPERITRELDRALRKNTRAVIMTAAPNTCSLRLPLEVVGKYCRKHGLLFIVDGAQGAGHFDINVQRDGISALIVPSHKGLFGIQGSGALILADGVLPRPMAYGGSGSASFDSDMPRELPDRYEAGTLPLPAVASLIAGIKTVTDIGVDNIENHEKRLFERCRNALFRIPKVSLVLPKPSGSVISFNVGDIPSETVARELDKRGICVRGGFHCAPWAHKALATTSGGTVRASFSAFTTARDVDCLVAAVEDIAARRL